MHFIFQPQQAACLGVGDFAFMLEKVPGAYINLGNGEASVPVPDDRYDFNDAAIPYGAAMFARPVARRPVP